MSAGIVVTAVEMNNLGGSQARGLLSAMDNVGKFKAWLDAYSAQGLVDAGLSATLADANIFKSAWTDLGDINTIWKGGTPVQTIAGHDFRVFPLKIAGILY